MVSVACKQPYTDEKVVRIMFSRVEQQQPILLHLYAQTHHGSGQDAQDAAFGTTRNITGWWRRWQQVAIVGSRIFPIKDGQLSFKGQNGRVDPRRTDNGTSVTV
jgi:hypothetical protein